MEASRGRIKAAIAVNCLIVILEIVAIGYSLALRGFAGTFMYYTQCSNALGCVACALCAVAEIRQLRDGLPLSRWLRWLKYAACCCLLMTFLVSAAILAPMLEFAGRSGFYYMFVESVKSILHLFGPLLVTVSYIAFEADTDMTFRQSFVGFVPTIVYAAVAYPCNIARVWDGPYPFLQVWNMSVWMSMLWFILLVVMSVALCQVPRLISRRRK